MTRQWDVPDAATLGQLIDHPPAAGFRVSAVQTTYFRDVYYDTPDGELRQRGGRYRMRFTADGKQHLTVWFPDGTRLDTPGTDAEVIAARVRALVDPAKVAPWIERDVARRWRTIGLPLVRLPLCDFVGDSITVRYTTSGSDGILTCTGTSSTGAILTYINTFSVVKNAAGVGQLVCTRENGVLYPLINGVENLSVTYGVNTTGSGNNVDSYQNADQVTAASNWSNVISLQIELTFANPLYVAGAPQGQPATIVLRRNIAVMNQTGL